MTIVAQDRLGPLAGAGTLGPGWNLSAPTAHLPDSAGRFADGATHRIEIPSVEGPRCLEAVLDAAQRWEVPVVRLSQGSGTMLLTDSEIRDMVALASDGRVELCLFIRPNAGWDAGAASRSAAGAAFDAATWGEGQLRASVQELIRVAELGVRSVLIGDVGLLSVFGSLRDQGILPAEMQAKTSVMLPTSNSATAAVYADLGADTLNVVPDLPISDIAGIRDQVLLPLDVYIEAPDNVGGFVRYHELTELVRVACPVYVKLGVRNSAGIYPSGSHLESLAVALSVERVRRARIALDVLERAGITGPSVAGAAGLAIPVGMNR